MLRGKRPRKLSAALPKLIQEALEQDDDETRTKMLRQALVALDREAEQ